MKLQHFIPGNSSFPSQNMSIVMASGKNFLVGIRDGKYDATRMYLLETDISKITLTNESIYSMSDLKENLTAKNLKYTSRAIDRETKIISVNDINGNELIKYSGIELFYLRDIILWHNKLIFATNTDLYISEPVSNKLLCLIGNPEMTFYSLCALDSQLYIGTSAGLFYISSEKFLEIAKQAASIN